MRELRKSLYFVLCLIFGAYLLSGCIEEYEADISEEDSDLLVVEGTICSGEMNKFILTRTQAIRSDVPLSSDMNSYYKPRTVTGASISIHGSDGSEYRAQETNGYYSCLVGTLNPDAEYYLHIETGGDVYESEPQKPLRTEEIADVIGVQNTPESNIDVLVTPDVPFDPNKTNYYSWTYDETWEVHPEYKTNMYYDMALNMGIFKMHQFPDRGWKDAADSTIMVGASANYEGQHIQKLKIYDIDRSDERVFHMYSGLVHQRAITKAEYEYEFARQQASADMGGLFTPLPSALPTNIHCLTSSKHVIGYIGCSLNTSEYRFFLNADDFSIQYPRAKDDLIWAENPSDALCRRYVNEGLFLVVWQDGRRAGESLETAWATIDQLDVRCQGAYIEIPDFWPIEEDNEE